MKATELRIGNITYNKDDIAIRVCMNGLLAYYGSATPQIEANIFKPIPLTEEWLKKFGFEISNTVGGFTCWELGKFRLLDGKLPAMSYTERIDYVHQLQNLYFALTGRELTVK